MDFRASAHLLNAVEGGTDGGKLAGNGLFGVGVGNRGGGEVVGRHALRGVEEEEVWGKGWLVGDEAAARTISERIVGEGKGENGAADGEKTGTMLTIEIYARGELFPTA